MKDNEENKKAGLRIKHIRIKVNPDKSPFKPLLNSTKSLLKPRKQTNGVLTKKIHKKTYETDSMVNLDKMTTRELEEYVKSL